MVSTTGEPIFTSLMEILIEILIDNTGTLCRFDIDKPDRVFVYLSVVLQTSCQSISPAVTDVNTMDLIPLRVVDIPIQGTPTEAERSDEDIIKEEDVKPHY